MKILIASMCLLVLPSILLAGAFEDLEKASGQPQVAVRMAALSNRMKAEIGKAPAGIPRAPKDVFAGCHELLTGKAPRPVDLPQAVHIVQACLDKSYKPKPNERWTYSVTASAGRMSCGPGYPRTAECAGIYIKVTGTILAGDHILEDLHYSVDTLRKGKLLGWRTLVLK